MARSHRSPKGRHPDSGAHCALSSRPLAARGAFSLVELVLVMAILAILVGMAVPRYAQAIARQGTDAAARRLVADLALAQRSARICGETRSVVLDTTSGTYQLQSESSKPAGPECHLSTWGAWRGGCDPLILQGETYNCIVRLGNEPYNARVLSADFGGDNEITFNGFGDPNSGGTVTVGVGQYTKTITINGNTGKAAVQ